MKTRYTILTCVVACFLAASTSWAQTVPSNDDFGDAEELDSDEGCTGEASFTTANATSDEDPGSCQIGGPNNNVWFTFEATDPTVAISMYTGGSAGDIRYATMTLWDEGLSEITCATFSSSGYDDLFINYDALVGGEIYYISVDNLAGYAGSFNLCVEIESNDFKSTALNIPQLNTCYNQSRYTTVGMTGDEPNPGCWYYGPFNNSWFEFTATTTQIDITLLTGGSSGNLKYPMVALIGPGPTTLDCGVFTNGGTKAVALSAVGLSIGETYYIEVDNPGGAQYQGRFTLCLDDGPGGDKNGWDPFPSFGEGEGVTAALFPSLTNDATSLWIKSLEQTGGGQVVVTDVAGSVMEIIRLPKGDEYRLGIDCNEFPAGVYLVDVQLGNERIVKKLVKQ